MAPFRDAGIIGNIHNYERMEVHPNQYYWHEDHGFRFCHYYDPWGFHWYGWYVGDDFFWTRYYYGRWWWFDPGYDRWCYWHDNGWWWQDPDQGLVFAYQNNNYVPADSASAPSANNGTNQTEYWDAADHRVVKVFGKDAFLYDTSKVPAFDPVFLASNVTDVKMNKAHNGRPLQILVTLEDGTFKIFNPKGKPVTH
jgi:hypothetical protein